MDTNAQHELVTQFINQANRTFDRQQREHFEYVFSERIRERMDTINRFRRFMQTGSYPPKGDTR